jgi:hypothetical protein
LIFCCNMPNRVCYCSNILFLPFLSTKPDNVSFYGSPNINQRSLRVEQVSTLLQGLNPAEKNVTFEEVFRVCPFTKRGIRDDEGKPCSRQGLPLFAQDLAHLSASPQRLGTTASNQNFSANVEALFYLIFKSKSSVHVKVDKLDTPEKKSMAILAYTLEHFWIPFGGSSKPSQAWTLLYSHLSHAAELPKTTRKPKSFPELFFRCRLLIQSLTGLLLAPIDGQHRFAAIIYYLMSASVPNHMDPKFSTMYPHREGNTNMYTSDLGVLDELLTPVMNLKPYTLVKPHLTAEVEEFGADQIRNIERYMKSASTIFQEQATLAKPRGIKEHLETTCGNIQFTVHNLTNHRTLE